MPEIPSPGTGSKRPRSAMGLHAGESFLGALQEAFEHFQGNGKRLTEARLRRYIRARYPRLEGRIIADRAAWEGSIRAKGIGLKRRGAFIRPECAYLQYLKSGSQGGFAEWLKAENPKLLAAARKKLEVFKRRASRKAAARETRHL